MHRFLTHSGSALALAGMLGAIAPLAPANAQTVVPFDGLVISSCVLSASTVGVLGVNTSSGTEIGTEQAGGVAAVLAVVATAGTPTITFDAPSLSAQPAAYSGTPTVSIAYTSPGGANQAYTNTQSQYTSTNPLGDTITINAKATDPDGFPAGNYTLQTVATCEQ